MIVQWFYLVLIPLLLTAFHCNERVPARHLSRVIYRVGVKGLGRYGSHGSTSVKVSFDEPVCNINST